MTMAPQNETTPITSFIDDQVHLLLKEAQHECQRTIESSPAETEIPSDGQLYCEAFWDGWSCWNKTLAGKRSYMSCPAHRIGFDSRLTAYRDCNADGTWWRNPITNSTWANYTSCVNVFELEKSTRLINMYIAGYSLSMVTLVLSIAIFIVFRRQLKCDRVTLHKHLFCSYILNGIAWILYYVLAALNATVITSNPVWCRVLHVVTQYFVTCNFFWMFCEGCYLHTIIVLAFTDSRKLLISCCVTGWGFPVVMTTVYAILRWKSGVLEELEQCWIKESSLQWVVSGPIVFTVAMNLIFLCNIVRELVTKMRAVHSTEVLQAQKAVKATLILIPLLGLQYILFPMRPPQGTSAEDIYLVVVALVTSLQGVFVAILFCFTNGEVIAAMKHRWQQYNSTTLVQSSNLYNPCLKSHHVTKLSMSDYGEGKSATFRQESHGDTSPAATSLLHPHDHGHVNGNNAQMKSSSSSRMDFDMVRGTEEQEEAELPPLQLVSSLA